MRLCLQMIKITVYFPS